MTERTITNSDGTEWSFAQTLANAGDTHAEAKHSERETEDDSVVVVATPRGGAQSVRLELPRDWAESMDDEALSAMLTSKD